LKNILIIGSPRSGTHALGSHIANDRGMINLGEICINDGETDPVQDIGRLTQAREPTIAHLVQMTGKIKISGLVTSIKKSCEILVLRRRDKIQQFASWMYFHRSGGVMRSWHNHAEEQMYLEQQQITVTDDDIDQFLLEQLLDDFFQPDQVLYYEDLDLSKSLIKKNQYAWNLPLIFANLTLVRSRLQDWAYHEKR